jgi:glutamate/aspartate transport system substrate-binding protein
MKLLSYSVVLIMALGLPAYAQDGVLNGTLAKIRTSGTVTLGVRDSALPFSYRLPSGVHAGYAVDLCRELVDDISAELDNKELAVAYKVVTAENRIAQVVSGDVDIECGSTTRNKERQQQVAFSPVFFVAGTKLMVSRQSLVRSYRDLVGKTVVVTSGTTNEQAIHVLVDRLLLRLKIIAAPDHTQSFALLRDGKADAFATDDVLLAGLAATRAGMDYHVVGDFLSYDPYGLMFRKDDPAFAAVIDRGFRRMAESRRLSELYSRWLQGRLPTGESLNMPISAELTEMWRVLGQPD